MQKKLKFTALFSFILTSLLLTGCNNSTHNNEKEYYCSDDSYILDEYYLTCTKKTIVDAKKSYYCSDVNYILDSSKGVCSKKTTIPAIKEYSCFFGEELVGDKCIDTYESYASSRTTCPYGYTSTGYKECKKTGTYTYGNDCPYGYSGSYSSDKCYPIIDATEEYSCFSGTLTYPSYGSPKCIKTTESYANYDYVCDYGYELDLFNCVKEEETNALYNYVCEDGFELDGHDCVKTEELDAKY